MAVIRRTLCGLIKCQHEQVSSAAKPEDKMLEIFMNKLLENPQKGIQSFDALMKLQEKIEKVQNNQK